MEPDTPLKLPRLRWKGRAAYFDHGGTPRRWEALGKDPAAIQRRYAELMAARRVQAGTVDAMIGECIEAMRGEVAAGTLANYRSYRKHLSAVFGHQVPDELTQADVLRYGRLCPRTSWRGEVALLSMAFVRWMDAGLLEFNPCFGVRVRGKRPSKRDRLLAPDEIDAIVARADERMAVAIELAYALGLRISDACRLTWRALDAHLDTLKTGQKMAWERTPEFDALLARCRALQARVGSLYVLCDRRGRPWKTGTLRDHWNAAVAASGVPDAHFHDLRAAGASALEAATSATGQDGEAAAQLFLGHAHRTTTRIYLRGRRVNVVRPLTRKRSA